MTGRPRIAEYDALRKSCAICGASFGLRDKRLQSLGNFQRRKYCSLTCTNAAKRTPAQDRAEVLFAHTEKGSDDECWVWQGRLTHNGYGRFSHGGKDHRAHRVAYELSMGPIPRGLMILHCCDNRRCVNPAHLRPGTAAENYDDAYSRGRVARPRLSPAQREAILNSTESHYKTAKKVGCGVALVERIRARRDSQPSPSPSEASS
jgi:hypothetical protein